MHNVAENYGSALAATSMEKWTVNSSFVTMMKLPCCPPHHSSPPSSPADCIASHCQKDVLNIAANSGEHSLYLLSKGVNVISLDASPIACAVMHQRGVPSIICGDLFEQSAMFNRSHTWLAMNYAIGLLGNIRNFTRFLRLAHQNLHHKGRLILCSTDPVFEGYRTRQLSYEFEGYESDKTPWFEIGVTTLKTIAESNYFSTRILYIDELHKYVAILIKEYSASPLFHTAFLVTFVTAFTQHYKATIISKCNQSPILIYMQIA